MATKQDDCTIVTHLVSGLCYEGVHTVTALINGDSCPSEQFLLLIPVPVLGVHHGCLLSTDMGGPKVDVRGPGRDIEAQ